MKNTMARYVHHICVHKPSVGMHKRKFLGVLPWTSCRGVTAPLQTRRQGVLPCGASHGKNITHIEHYPSCCFISTQEVLREIIHFYIPIIPICSLHQENFLVLTNFVNAFTKFFKVSNFDSNTFFSSNIFLTK